MPQVIPLIVYAAAKAVPYISPFVVAALTVASSRLIEPYERDEEAAIRKLGASLTMRR